MKENDIRPAGLRKKGEKLFKLDARELLDKSRKFFVEVDCPACSRYNARTEFNKDGYAFKKCSKCRTLYISPRPTPAILKNYYSTSRVSKFWQKEMFPASRKMRCEKIHRPRVKIIRELLAKYKFGTKLLVDVGAGSGDFGLELAKRGIFKKIILVEPGHLKIEKYASNTTIEVMNDIIENVKLNTKPDIITNFELIEHLFSPAVFLKNVYNLLDKGSFFMFTTPNLEGFELLTIYNKSLNVAGPDHLNYFNVESIRMLLKRVGFKVIEVATIGELDADIVRNGHLEDVIDISNQSFLYHMLIKKPKLYMKPFQLFLQENNLSSNMLIIAQK